SGSVWTNALDVAIGFFGSGNSLVISNQGKVVHNSDYFNYVAWARSSSNNTVMVTGSNSAWHCGGELAIGYSGSRNSLTIGAGGRVINPSGHSHHIGYQIGANENRVLVTGAGSVWSN